MTDLTVDELLDDIRGVPLPGRVPADLSEWDLSQIKTEVWALLILLHASLNRGVENVPRARQCAEELLRAVNEWRGRVANE